MKLRHLAQLALTVLSTSLLVGCPLGPYTQTAELDPSTDVGRYWAHLSGAVVAGTNEVNVWFEVRLSEQTDWSFVRKTAEVSVPGNTTNDEGEYPAVAMEGWVYGLTPQTSYEFRSCHREEGSTESTCTAPKSFTTQAPSTMRWVEIDPTDPQHLAFDDGERFIVWGSNYVKVNQDVLLNDLVEDQMYTDSGRALIAQDFVNLSNVSPPNGVLNAVRMHLQLHEFLLDPTTPDPRALAAFARVIEMAEDQGLYVMVTGLNYFYPAQNPDWVANASDEEHWATQALWWTHMAHALHQSPAVMAYDLVNEPYATGAERLTDDGQARWTGAPPDGYCDYGANADLGKLGTCFGQHVTAQADERSGKEIADAWTQKMVHAIRYNGFFPNDPGHLITVGVGGNIGLNNPFSSSPEVHAELDFASPHLYPDSEDNGEAKIELAAAISEISGKPLIAGETFSFGPVDRLISRTCNFGTVQGWFGQYDGRTRTDLCPDPGPFGCLLHNAWYDLQAELGPTMLAGQCPALIP